MKKWTFFFPAAVLLTAATQLQGGGQWHLVKTKNKIDARSECGLAAADGKLYLIGGDGPAMPVEAYDPKTEAWTKKATAPMVMHHFQAVSYGDRVYVLDAFSNGGFPNQTPMENTWCYDTKKDSWLKLAGLPEARRRAGAGAAEYKGKLYLVAGITHGHASGTNGMFDVYDPATNTWTALPDAPHIRDHSMAVVINDKLYAVGGRNTSFRDPENKIQFFSQVMLDVDCYDFATKTWSTLTSKLPLGTGGGTAVNLDNKIYYIGGERAAAIEQNRARKDVFMVDPAQDNGWVTVSSLNKDRNGVGGAVLDHRIYIAGGSGGGPGGPPPGGGPGGPPPGMGGPPQGGNQQGPPPQDPQNGGNQQPGDIALEVFKVGK